MVKTGTLLPLTRFGEFAFCQSPHSFKAQNLEKLLCGLKPAPRFWELQFKHLLAQTGSPKLPLGGHMARVEIVKTRNYLSNTSFGLSLPLSFFSLPLLPSFSLLLLLSHSLPNPIIQPFQQVGGRECNYSFQPSIAITPSGDFQISGCSLRVLGYFLGFQVGTHVSG